MDKIRALVVDDEASVCEAMKAILEIEGIDVIATTSSVGAVDIVRKNSFDLIVSDLKMPVMDGFQFYEKVREIDTGSVFIIITAFGTIPSAVDAIKKGVYDYIPKPFTPDEVRISIRRALEKKRKTSQGEKDPGKRRAKAYRYLYSRGFSASIIAEVIHLHDDENI